jgi:hypothetical protein
LGIGGWKSGVDTRALSLARERRILHLAPIDQIVDTPSKAQIAIIEHYLARQNEQRHVIDPSFVDVKLGVRHVHDYTERAWSMKRGKSGPRSESSLNTIADAFGSVTCADEDEPGVWNLLRAGPINSGRRPPAPADAA